MHREQIIYYQAAPLEKQSTATLESEIAKCLNFIETSLTGWGLEKKHVIKQNIFLYATGKSDFYKRKKAVTDTLKDFYKDDYPPTGIIGQPPAGNTLLATELTVLTSKTQATITRKDTDNIRYIILDYPGFKKIYTAGITHNENTSNTMQQSQEAFAIMKKILTEEGMEFS
ncbi:MAG: hypothetical protein GY757_32445, partial [bacterium]|nr:hypothetical protein [bacterium]